MACNKLGRRTQLASYCTNTFRTKVKTVLTLKETVKASLSNGWTGNTRRLCTISHWCGLFFEVAKDELQFCAISIELHERTVSHHRI